MTQVGGESATEFSVTASGGFEGRVRFGVDGVESLQKVVTITIGGRYYRVVGYQTRSGGHGAGCEVWTSGRWLFPSDGPGCHEVMAAAPASPEELRRAGVDCTPISSAYDPMSVECE